MKTSRVQTGRNEVNGNPDVCPMHQARSGAAQINFLQLQDNLQMYIEFFERIMTMNGYENVLLSQFSDIWECSLHWLFSLSTEFSFAIA